MKHDMLSPVSCERLYFLVFRVRDQHSVCVWYNFYWLLSMFGCVCVYTHITTITRQVL